MIVQLLKDIRVLDLGGFVSGPSTAAVLASFGADVIKVERPGTGDPFRALSADMYSPQFQANNHNKRSVTLDYSRTDGLAVFLKLVKAADVVVVNFRPGTAEKLGIGYSALRAENPRLVYCAITGFGPDGPYANRPAFDHVGQALSGWLSRHRQNDDPRVVGPVISDRVTGYHAALGILSALHERQRSGDGHLVEVNMLETTLAFGIEPVIQHFASGKPVPIYIRGAFSQAYSLTCKDERRLALHLSSPDKFWLILCKTVGRQEWVSKYPTHPDRVRGYDEIAAELAKIFRTRERAEWMKILEKDGLPFAPEHEVQDLESDPQITHLKVFYEVEHPKFGKIKNAHRPAWVDGSRDIEFRPPPALGESNDEIFKEIGLSPSDIEKLRASGTI